MLCIMLCKAEVKQLWNTSSDLLQLQLFPKFFKILDPPFKFYLSWEFLVSWTLSFLCYKFGFSWVWIEFNCLPLSEVEWLFLSTMLLTVKFEVFWLMDDFLFRCQKFYEQWIRAVVLYAATIAEGKWWMFRRLALIFSDSLVLLINFLLCIFLV